MSLGLIWCYLISPILGFLAVVVVFAGTALLGRETPMEKLLKLLIITTPLYMVPVIPGLPPLFSWTSVLLVLLSIALAWNGDKVSPLATYSVLTFLLVGLFTAVAVDPVVDGLYHFTQLLLFIMPVLFAYRARRYLSRVLPSGFGDTLLLHLAGTVAAMAVGVLMQWALSSFAGILLGNISYFQARVTYDLTISAFSVMSGVLSLGIVIAPGLWRRDHRVLAVVLPVLSAVAILINTSRTGLFAAAVAAVLIILFPPSGASRVNSRLAIIPISVFLWLIYQSLMGLDRFSSSSGVFDDNGRFQSYANALSIFGEKIQNVFVGLGYGYDFATNLNTNPHNFIVETLVKSGVIVSVILFIWIGAILVHLRSSDWFFLLLSLLLGSMFYSGFYAVKVFTVVAVFGIIARACAPREEAVSDRHRSGALTRSG